MATKSRAFTTDSMPERIQLTKDLERRFKEQEDGKLANSPQALRTVHATKIYTSTKRP